MRRRGSKPTVALSMTKIAPNHGRETECLSFVKDKKPRFAGTGTDGSAHAADAKTLECHKTV